MEEDIPDRTREYIAVGREIDWEQEAKYGTIFFDFDKGSQFTPLDSECVEELINKGYLLPDSTHNDSPEAFHLLQHSQSVERRYADSDLDIGLNGYMVSPFRDDARISLTGISIRSDDEIPEELQREMSREFDPDVIVLDNRKLIIEWD